MARVTVAEVQKIIPDIDETVVDVDEAIAIANEFVTDELVGKGLSDTRLKRIEQYLSAHFLAVHSPRIAMERAGPVSESVQWRLGLNLQVTMYGQQALLLDTTGSLAAASSGNKRQARMTSLTMHDE